MPQYVAFLRAVNVGGRIIKMDELRRRLDALGGFTNVATFIASGNVIFESRTAKADAVERKIETGLRAWLGYEVETFLRTTEALAGIVAQKVFTPADRKAPGHRMYVGFTKTAVTPAVSKALKALETPNDSLVAKGSEVYWLSRVPMSESVVTMAKLEKALAAKATFRNISTVEKLVAKYS